MKRIISIILAAAVILSLAISAGASFVPDEYPDFVVDKDYDDDYSVIKYNGTASVVEVPELLYEGIIKRVGTNAFKGNSDILSLIFHDKMTKVGSWGARSCPNLEYVYYSKSFSVFEDRAFAGNPKLRDALLRATSLTDIQLYCFQNDSSIKYIALPDTLTKLGKYAFSGTSAEIVVIPESVTSIDSSCFASIPSLRKIYIPGSVTALGTNLFKNSPDVTVYTTSGSAAQTYCETNSIPYELVDSMPSDKMGDVNFDGVVNDKDIYAMRSALNNEETDFNARNCDMNADCRFDINDVTALQSQLNHDYNIVYKYKSYSDTNVYEWSTRTRAVTSYKSDIREIAREYCPAVRSPYVNYEITDVSLSGDTINVSIDDSPRYYTVEFNGEETQYRYKETATLTAENDSYFVTNGRPAAYGSSYSFYVTGNVSFTSEESAPADSSDTASIDFNSYTVTDEKITIQLLATADVSSFKRMGVVFAGEDKSKEDIAEAAVNIEKGTGVHNKIAVHNSNVQKANISGQYQFIYEPYMSLVNAKNASSLFFWTFAVTEEGEVVISDVAAVDISSVLA